MNFIQFWLIFYICFYADGLGKVSVDLKGTTEIIGDDFISLSEGLGMKEHEMLWIFQNQDILYDVGYTYIIYYIIYIYNIPYIKLYKNTAQLFCTFPAILRSSFFVLFFLQNFILLLEKYTGGNKMRQTVCLYNYETDLLGSNFRICPRILPVRWHKK